MTDEINIFDLDISSPVTYAYYRLVKKARMKFAFLDRTAV